MTGPHIRSAVALIAALDTKADDAAYVRDILNARGVEVRLIDVGVYSESLHAPAHTSADVAARGGVSLEKLRAKNDRSTAVATMAEGTRQLVAELLDGRLIDGVLAIGGGAGTTIGATAMRDLPLGIPKVILSTVAAGNTADYLGTSDIVMVPSIVDVAGVNSISKLTYASAAHAMAGMLEGRHVAEPVPASRPVVAASMFGVTTPAVLRAKELLETQGFEVIVFHATGVGGRTMERLCAEGHLAAVLDLTTTEWADEAVGGILSAGPGRLTAAAQAGVPQVVSVGATDMVNFGRPDSIPPVFSGRRFYEHNAENTLMRTSVEEAALIGRNIGMRINQATGPATVLIPDGGVSALDAPGMAFDDPAAREALTEALVAQLTSPRIRIVRTPCHINDPQFAQQAADELVTLVAANPFQTMRNT